MILDGDILAYFNEIGVDVEESSYEDTFSFIFQISYSDFDLNATFTIDRSLNLLSFMVSLPNPEEFDLLPEALNAINSNSTLLKAYYDKLDDTVYVKASTFVTEDNCIQAMDFILTSMKDLDYEYIENLYNSIYKEDYDSFDDEFEKAHKDTSIEEDMAELMELLKNKNR
ncbi:putative sensory transduction regulator [Anaeroplasma bactoclasticum]|jgi:hypothetical protein|uniref:Putative sensory transduction regulator n=1 Tax=Anaeroplasma bactoclasticum TaxID=2088 RepID=A0A397RP47_9MOLU|nr:YbjN domain-containing protein [Anaeroplasma bactoclasticum]RIA73955.1 putative sensory transduction regulator [Anaeroplasma bactoclasticum]